VILHPQIKNCAKSITKSNYKKRATKIQDDQWKSIIGTPNFWQTGKQKFSVKILQVKRNFISVGIALDTVDFNSYIHGENNSWMVCFCCGGKIFDGKGNRKHVDMNQFEGKLKAGDVLSVEMDMDHRLFQFYINEKPAGPAVQVLLNGDHKSHLAPAIDLNDQNDSIEFI